MHDIVAEEVLQIEKGRLKRKKEQVEIESKLAGPTAKLSEIA